MVVDGKMGQIGGGSMRFAAVVVFIVECVLSHTPGDRSGRQSETLAKLSGVDEGLLRRFAHVFLFLVLGVLAGAGFGWIGIGAAAVWAVVDELTKPLVPGRHFSWIDVGLNLAGVAVGVGLWLVLR